VPGPDGSRSDNSDLHNMFSSVPGSSSGGAEMLYEQIVATSWLREKAGNFPVGSPNDDGQRSGLEPLTAANDLNNR
jgi:hypothetical protein